MERTLNTISAMPTAAILREEMIRVLDEMEAEGRQLSDFPPELVKLGVVIGLAVAGPAETLEGLARLLLQLAAEFPDAWRSATAKFNSMGRTN